MLTLTFLTLGSFLHSKLQSIYRGRLALRTFFGKIGRGSKCLIKHFGKTIRGSKCKSVAIDYSRLYVLPVSHFDDVWSHVATESCHIQCTEDRASTSSTSGTLNKSHKMPQDATRCHTCSKFSVDILRNCQPTFNIFAIIFASNLASCV